jgi:ATPase complex subunit ATP10
MKFHKGKSFIAPPRLFKAEHALYFPNFHGQTLHKDKATRDTTPVLQDKISIVSIFSNQWAENQAATFVSAKENAKLHEIVRSSKGAAQFVQINVEDNVLKAWIVKMFMPGLRKKLGIENWGKYFLVRKAPPDQAKDAIGFINSKVGYVYLLDGDCKIRWAGSGNSEGDEKEGLVKGVKRLLEDLQRKRLQPASKTTEENPVETDKAAAPAA